ncbi:hypothetical protein SB861_58165, partial [Paraburkholderia sp. SIMBA_049]
AAPGGAGEALVGQTSSSGVRLSDHRHAFSANVSRRGASCTPLAAPPLARSLGHSLARLLAFACNCKHPGAPFLTHRFALFSYTP